MKFFELRRQDPATRTYLGSPSLVRLPNGDLLATHDYYGPGCARVHEHEGHLTSVYRSSDNGSTWRNINHIANAYWSTLFLHHGSVYLLGCTQSYGSIVIRRSDDGGNTWTHPTDRRTGLLFKGGYCREAPNYLSAALPVLVKDGRLYRAFDDCDPCILMTGVQAGVISVPADCDLLDGGNWTMSNKLPYDPRWTPSASRKLEAQGWVEGNVLESPDGEIWNIMRFNATPESDTAAILRVHDAGARITFDPCRDFIEFPGGYSRFTIRFDPISRSYITLSNYNEEPVGEGRFRNVLSLSASRDLRNWRLCKVLLADDTGVSKADSMQYTGFQYADWQFDGEDIIYLVRTAYGGAASYHDANLITFHRLERFRHVLDIAFLEKVA